MPKALTANGSTSAGKVFTRPSDESSVKVGTKRSSAGISNADIRSAKAAPRKRKSSFASA